MKRTTILNLFLLASIVLPACDASLDPLSPGSTDGKYAIGTKALVPLVIGNRWTYDVSLYDTSGVESVRYTYALVVVNKVTTDTSLIPTSSANKQKMKPAALTWYLFEGDNGATTCWQVDTLENLLIRSSDDRRFFEQIPFNFRASVNDTSAAKATSADINIWGWVDTTIANDDVRTVLVSVGIDTLRTTLGSAQYYHYRQLYARRTYYTDYYFKPGFGLLLIERYSRKPDGTAVCIRRDRLVSYYFG